MRKTTLLLTTLSFVFTIAISQAQPLQRFEYSQAHMGTSFKIILYANGKILADTASSRAFQRINELNQIMSDYLPDSELSLLSQSPPNKKIKVSRDLYHILKRSKKWSKKTNGYFDVTIGPLSKRWRKAFRQKVVPSPEEIAVAKSRVNYQWLKLHWISKKVSLKKEKMRIDLGGIAKGYAIDEAMKILKNFGIRSALVEGGGDILVSDAPPDKGGWQIISPNFKNLLFLKNEAIATSGSTYQFVEWEGNRYAHIINPKTGYGIKHKRLLTVIAKNCTDADALASACSLLNHQQIDQLKKSKKWEISIWEED